MGVTVTLADHIANHLHFAPVTDPHYSVYYETDASPDAKHVKVKALKVCLLFK